MNVRGESVIAVGFLELLIIILECALLWSGGEQENVGEITGMCGK